MLLPLPKPHLIVAVLLVLSQTAGAWAAVAVVNAHASHHVALAQSADGMVGAMDCEHPGGSCCDEDDACAPVCTIACAVTTAHALTAGPASALAPTACEVPGTDIPTPPPPHLRELIRPPCPRSV